MVYSTQYTAATLSIRSHRCMSLAYGEMGSKRSNGSSLQIPVIDLQISEATEADTAEQLVDAVARYGFVFIKGEETGFTKQIVDDTFALVRPNQFLDQTDNSNDIDSQKDSSRQPQRRKKNVLSKPM